MSCKKRLEHRQTAIELQEKQQKRVFFIIGILVNWFEKAGKQNHFRFCASREKLITICSSRL
jgi:hypothetical protein